VLLHDVRDLESHLGHLICSDHGVGPIPVQSPPRPTEKAAAELEGALGWGPHDRASMNDRDMRCMATECLASASDDENYITHNLQKSDTLAGLAVQYNVAVSDIKRANGLMSEGMMWSRSTLMIPRHSIPLSDEQQRQVAKLVSGFEPIESTRSSRRRQRRPLESDRLAHLADQLNSYYELSESAIDKSWAHSPRRLGVPGSEVEMGTLPAGEVAPLPAGEAGTSSSGDDRVRFRGRRRGPSPDPS
jgi:hypothetical protein